MECNDQKDFELPEKVDTKTLETQDDTINEEISKSPDFVVVSSDESLTVQKTGLSPTKTKSGDLQSFSELYRPPVWAMTCPVDAGYRLEVIKNGIPLPECTIDLASSSTECDSGSSALQLSFCLFGRLPQQFYAPFNQLYGQCAPMAHPSISRFHGVLQYGRPPPSIARTSATRMDLPGWYLQDMDSTHGTFVNKRRLPPGRFVRIHVGHVIRFGGSTRLYLLSGPEEDREDESAQSWTELKEAYRNRQLAQQICNSTNNSEPKEVDLGCDWGFSADDGAENSNFLANIKGAVCLTHEHLYQDDPKRALKAYFEREGIEPAPEFEFVDAAFGKQHCRIE